MKDDFLARAIVRPRPKPRWTLDSLMFWAGAGFVSLTVGALLYKSWLNFWIVTERLVQ